jgi:hypothetical protein
MYGCLQHSTSACIYFMPPHGPSRTDLALMAGLSQHVALLTVVGKADAMTAGEAADCCRAVQHMLAEPAEYVPGIPGGASIAVYRRVSAQLNCRLSFCRVGSQVLVSVSTGAHLNRIASPDQTALALLSMQRVMVTQPCQDDLVCILLYFALQAVCKW